VISESNMTVWSVSFRGDNFKTTIEEWSGTFGFDGHVFVEAIDANSAFEAALEDFRRAYPELTVASKPVLGGPIVNAEEINEVVGDAAASLDMLEIVWFATDGLSA
jgi:hypothetical protein